MTDHLAAITHESDRFAAAARAAVDLTGPAVPTCPDWTLDDLVWHLTEVQAFWTAIVADGAAGPEVERPVRPAPGELVDRFVEVSAGLVDALSAADPAAPCWSWHPDGGSVGWVRRRQAHEALIHRVDAELTVAGPDGVSPVDPALAADGVDEMLRLMLDAGSALDGARWEADGPVIRIETVEPGPAIWLVELGRVVATGADDGPDLPALVNLDPHAADGPRPQATLRGPAAEIDRWLWRRGSLRDSTVDGDRALVDQLVGLAEMT